jgi:hypothetical protein
MYLLEKESAGLSVLITIWQLIYQNKGYYINNNSDLNLMIKKRISLDTEIIKDCINTSLSRNIFDSGMQKRHSILTSRAIQKRFFTAAEKKKQVLYNPKFMLIDVSGFHNLIKTEINGVNVSENATNVNVEVKEDVKVDIEVKGKEDGQTDFISKIFLDCWGIPSIRITTQQRMIMEGWIPLYGEREIQLACNEAVKQGKDHKALAYIEKIMSNKVQKIAIEKSKAEALKKKIEVQESATSKPWTKGILLNELYDDEGRLKKVIK